MEYFSFEGSAIHHLDQPPGQRDPNPVKIAQNFVHSFFFFFQI